jgi:hypothetical protein
MAEDLEKHSSTKRLEIQGFQKYCHLQQRLVRVKIILRPQSCSLRPQRSWFSTYCISGAGMQRPRRGLFARGGTAYPRSLLPTLL